MVYRFTWIPSSFSVWPPTLLHLYSSPPRTETYRSHCLSWQREACFITLNLSTKVLLWLRHRVWRPKRRNQRCSKHIPIGLCRYGTSSWWHDSCQPAGIFRPCTILILWTSGTLPPIEQTSLRKRLHKPSESFRAPIDVFDVQNSRRPWIPL